MKKLALSLVLALSSYAGFSQEETLGQKINQLTFDWDLKSEELNSYEGLGEFCQNLDYRTEFVQLLNDIHHYDSVLYQRLLRASRTHHSRDIQKAIKDIEEFEKGYSMKKFIHFLHQECIDQKDIEKHAKELKTEIGSESYSGQIYILEIELNKYIKHITTRVDHIRKHVDHFHVK
jgi:hypothetical protein